MCARPWRPEKFCHGAGQETGWRAGTENVLEIVGLGKACDIAQRDLAKNMTHMEFLRGRLLEGLLGRISDIRLNGHVQHRLPNTLSISFRGREANRILENIGVEVAASAGAACHSDAVKISHVLEAMGVPLEWAKGTLRFSVGRMTTEAEVDRTVRVVAAAVNPNPDEHEVKIEGLIRLGRDTVYFALLRQNRTAGDCSFMHRCPEAAGADFAQTRFKLFAFNAISRSMLCCNRAPSRCHREPF